ncbi:MAG: SURF1 family protein [Thiohalomonadaceae bacterium]
MKAGKASIGERGRLAAAIGLLGACGLFVALGVWQLARAEAQDARLASARAALAAPLLDLQREQVTARHAYRRAHGEGEFMPVQYFLQGRSDMGRSGYGAVAVLHTGGRHILVERGFTPVAEGAAPAGRVRVEGVLVPVYRPPLRMGEPSGFVRPFLDPRALARELNIELAPLVLHAKPPPLPPLKSAMHVGYAVQWFVFALVAIVAALALFRNR